MTARIKITEDQITLARAVIEKRREAQRLVDMYPSILRLAKQLGCSERYLQKVLAGKERIGNALRRPR